VRCEVFVVLFFGATGRHAGLGWMGEGGRGSETTSSPLPSDFSPPLLRRIVGSQGIFTQASDAYENVLSAGAQSEWSPSM
jgi:hypothetical protein